jgi:excisionase family DNA binding protein
MTAKEPMRDDLQPVERATYTVSEAGQRLGISRATAYRAVKDGDLPSIRIGRRLVVPREAVEQMLAHDHQAQAEQRQTEPEAEEKEDTWIPGQDSTLVQATPRPRGGQRPGRGARTEHTRVIDLAEWQLAELLDPDSLTRHDTPSFTCPRCRAHRSCWPLSAGSGASVRAAADPPPHGRAGPGRPGRDGPATGAGTSSRWRHDHGFPPRRCRPAAERFVAFPSEHDRHAVAAGCCTAGLWTRSTPLRGSRCCRPEKGSGKTRTLEVLELLVPRPHHTVNMSAAVLFRLVGDTEAGTVTLLMDEADTYLGWKVAREHEDVRGLVNAGHRRTAHAYRMQMEGGAQVVAFPAFAPVALAGIGDLPDTIIDRSVVVSMKRRSPVRAGRPVPSPSGRARGLPDCATPSRLGAPTMSTLIADRLDHQAPARCGGPRRGRVGAPGRDR